MSIRDVRQAIIEVHGRIQEWDDLGRLVGGAHSLRPY